MQMAEGKGRSDFLDTAPTPYSLLPHLSKRVHPPRSRTRHANRMMTRNQWWWPKQLG